MDATGVIKLANFPGSVTGIVRKRSARRFRFPPKASTLKARFPSWKSSICKPPCKPPGGVRSQAADLLKMSYRSFRHYAKKYGV